MKEHIEIGEDIYIDFDVTKSKMEEKLEFSIDEYAKMYFLGNIITVKELEKKKLAQSSVAVEDAVMSYLGSDKWDELAVFRMLAWKTGKIKHKESEKNFNESIEDFIVYHDKWIKEDNNRTVQLPYRKQMDSRKFKALAKEIIKLKNKYEHYSDTNKNDWKMISEVWNGLLDYVYENKISGLGTVYMITLLFFITGGICPIYDRFAMASLNSLLMKDNKEKLLPVGSIIKLHGLPGKNLKEKMRDLIIDPNSEYRKYIALLNMFFKDDWQKNRDIDRALWVYGHLFTVK